MSFFLGPKAKKKYKYLIETFPQPSTPIYYWWWIDSYKVLLEVIVCEEG